MARADRLVSETVISPPVSDSVRDDAGGNVPVDDAQNAPVKGQLIVYTADYVLIKQGYRYVQFLPGDLLFLQAAGNYTDIITSASKYTLRLVLGKLIEQVALADLIRIHRCYAVNRQQVHSLGDGCVRLGPHTVPVGRSYRDALLSHFRQL